MCAAGGESGFRGGAQVRVELALRHARQASYGSARSTRPVDSSQANRPSTTPLAVGRYAVTTYSFPSQSWRANRPVKVMEYAPVASDVVAGMSAEHAKSWL